MSFRVLDRLFYNGEGHWMYTEPLKEHLESIGLAEQLAPSKGRVKKGYKAEWRVVDEKLILSKWEATLNEEKLNLQFLFPNKLTVFADWYTGVISVGIGAYVVGEPQLSYEGILYLEFEKGILKDEWKRWRSEEEKREMIEWEEKYGLFMPF